MTDTNNHRIQIFDTDGNYVSQFGGSGSGDGRFNRPQGITTNSTHILIADTRNHRIQVFDIALTVTLMSSTPSGGIHNTGTISYTATFNDDVTGFDVTDITVSGTASGGMPGPSNFLGSGATYTFDVATTSDGTVTVSIPAGAATNTAGNANTVSDDYTVTVDTTAPILDTVATTNNTTIVVTALEPLAGTTVAGNYMVSGNTVTVDPIIAGSTITITVVTSIVGGTEITMDYTGTTVTDAAGNALGMFTGQTVVNNVPDITPPRIMSATTTTATTILLTASESLMGSTVAGNYRVSGNTVTNDPVILDNTITITVDMAIVAGSMVTVDYDGTGITDEAGNALGMFTGQSVVTDGAVVTIVSATGGPYKEGDTIDITVTFDESVTVSTVSGTPHLTLETGTNDAVANYFSGSPGTDIVFRYLVLTGHNSDDLNYVGTGSLDPNGGTILGTENRPARLLLPAITDMNSLGGNSAVIVDAVIPTVMITNTETSNGGTHNIGTISYTATFSEDVTDFARSDITVTGTASGGTPVVSNFDGSGTTYTFDVATDSDGTVIVTIPAGVATDAAANPNTVSNTYTITVDTIIPEIVSARISNDIITIIYNVPVTTDVSQYTNLDTSDSSTPTISSIANEANEDNTISLNLLSKVPAGTTATIDISGVARVTFDTLTIEPLVGYQVTAENDVSLTDTDNRVTVIDPDSTLARITYPSTVDATLDYSLRVEPEEGIPTAVTNDEIVITATGIRGGDIQVTIPATTSFSSSSFDGILILPTDSGSGCDSTAIASGTQASCIEIGQAGSVINTDNPIRIQLGGQTGNVPWYSQGGAVATQITVACTADDLTLVSRQLESRGECFINTGSDLIIWTAHFTVFGSNLVTPTPVVVEPEPEPTPASEPAPRRSGGGGHGNTLDPRVCGGVLCSEQGSNNQSSGTPSTSRSSSDQTSIVPRATPEQTQEPDRTQNDTDSMLGVPDPEPTPPPTDSESGAMMDPEPTPTPMDPEPTPTPMDPEPTPTPMDPEPGSTVAPERNEGILEQIGKWFTSLFG